MNSCTCDIRTARYKVYAEADYLPTGFMKPEAKPIRIEYFTVTRQECYLEKSVYPPYWSLGALAKTAGRKFGKGWVTFI